MFIDKQKTPIHIFFVFKFKIERLEIACNTCMEMLLTGSHCMIPSVLKSGKEYKPYAYKYNERIRKWEFTLIEGDSPLQMPDERNLMAHPLETWNTESGVKYVLSAIWYSPAAVNEHNAKHKASPPYQEGPRVYQLVAMNLPVCIVTKPFLMNAFKIYYGDRQEYRMMPDKTTLDVLKQEIRSLLKLSVTSCQVYRQLHV